MQFKKYSDSSGCGFKCTWFCLVNRAHNVFSSEKKAGLSIGESNIFDKMTSPRQLIFWDIGWLIKQIKETHEKNIFKVR